MNYCTPYPVAVNRRFLAFGITLAGLALVGLLSMLISDRDACSKPHETHAEYFTLAALFASNALYSAGKVQGFLDERCPHFRLKGAACQSFSIFYMNVYDTDNLDLS